MENGRITNTTVKSLAFECGVTHYLFPWAVLPFRVAFESSTTNFLDIKKMRWRSVAVC